MTDDPLGLPGLEWVARLGRGGSSTLSIAYDSTLDRQVAVKVIDRFDAAGDDRDAVERRFRRECRTLERLSSHPNIVTILSSGVHDDVGPYLVMELAGQSLADRLEAETRLAPSAVVDLGLAIAGALSAAHQAGVVHCDVKPANIVFAADGLPKLIDFGIASVQTDRTHRATVAATPAYAAPEVLQGGSSDPRSDVYSLACTMFACLEGAPPFGQTSESALGVLYEVLHAPPPTFTRTDLPPELVRVLNRAMAKEPDLRPATMDEFAGDLAAIDRPAAGGAGRSGRRPVLAAALAGSVLAIGLAVWLVGRNPSQAVVPDVEGALVTEVEASLTSAELTLAPHDWCADGRVASTDPQAGQEVAPGTPVAIIARCPAPDYIGMRLSAAIELVEATDGLQISWDDYCGDEILGQEVEPGQLLEPNQNVHLALPSCE